MLEQLIIADLSSNNIMQIKNDDLKQFVAIRQLILDHNYIDYFDINALKYCPLLQQITLNNNKLHQLPILSGISYL